MSDSRCCGRELAEIQGDCMIDEPLVWLLKASSEGSLYLWSVGVHSIRQCRNDGLTVW